MAALLSSSTRPSGRGSSISAGTATQTGEDPDHADAVQLHGLVPASIQARRIRAHARAKPGRMEDVPLPSRRS